MGFINAGDKYTNALNIIHKYLKSNNEGILFLELLRKNIKARLKKIEFLEFRFLCRYSSGFY